VNMGDSCPTGFLISFPPGRKRQADGLCVANVQPVFLLLPMAPTCRSKLMTTLGHRLE